MSGLSGFTPFQATSRGTNSNEAEQGLNAVPQEPAKASGRNYSKFFRNIGLTGRMDSASKPILKIAKEIKETHPNIKSAVKKEKNLPKSDLETKEIGTNILDPDPSFANRPTGGKRASIYYTALRNEKVQDSSKTSASTTSPRSDDELGYVEMPSSPESAHSNSSNEVNLPQVQSDDESIISVSELLRQLSKENESSVEYSLLPKTDEDSLGSTGDYHSVSSYSMDEESVTSVSDVIREDDLEAAAREDLHYETMPLNDTGYVEMPTQDDVVETKEKEPKRAGSKETGITEIDPGNPHKTLKEGEGAESERDDWS